MENAVRDIASELATQFVEWRRYFHQHPELGFQESNTADYIASLLREWGYETKTGLAGTGVTGLLMNGSDYTIGLRFDMDALPIQEDSEYEFKSIFPGVMHACGHDGHMAIGLGTACVLSQLRDGLTGNVKIIFQPAEEGLGGAKALIEAGVLDDPEVDSMLGLHIWPELEVGQIGVRPGVMMSAADRFDVTIYGSGGHGGLPHQSVDPIVLASEVVIGLQTIVSREVDPVQPVVITVGSITGGSAFNIIPESVTLMGTIRTVDPTTREHVIKRLEDKIQTITKAGKGHCGIRFQRCFSPLVNDPVLTGCLETTLSNMDDPDQLVALDSPSMTSEDFAEYQQFVPVLYFFLGTRNEQEGISYPLHHPRFAIDEEILAFGVQVMSNTTMNIFREFAGKLNG